MNSLEEARKAINEIDSKMAKLFCERMEAVKIVGEFKKENLLKIMDEEREAEIISKNSALVEDKLFRKYYVQFLKHTMALSRAYQKCIMRGMKAACSGTESELMMKTLRMDLGDRSYDIYVGRNLLNQADEYINLNRKVFVLTDSGVPKEYSEKILSFCKNGKICTVPKGEGSKSMKTLEFVLSEMLYFDMSRGDAMVSVGGGMVGDLGGFAASSFMRGIDFYQVPTTFLSQVDSSIGGKTAINFGNVKNVIGAFYQPKAVLIDINTLSTLSERLMAEGVAESVKMALTLDEDLFLVLENEGVTEDNIEDIILSSLRIKKSIVEADEKETGLRKILNFGHTLGHGIEADCSMGNLYHGECVAIGMLPMCSREVRKRLLALLEKLGLPTKYDGDLDNAIEFVIHDKKCKDEFLDIILVKGVGKCEIKKMSIEEFKNLYSKSLIL